MTTNTHWLPEWFTSGLNASFSGPRHTEDVKPFILAVFGTLLVAIASTFLLLRLRLHLRTSVSQSLSKTLKNHGKHRAKRFVPASHSWEVQDTGLTTPQLCDVCNELLADQFDLLAEQFQTCLVCGVSVHCSCASKAAPDCKRLCSRAKPRRKPEELLMHHHWVEKVQIDLGTDFAYESLLDENSCQLCSEPCNDRNIMPQAIWSCLWCQTSAHAACAMNHKKFAKYGCSDCPSGPVWRMIVPPTHVVEVKPPEVKSASKKGRMHQLRKLTQRRRKPSDPKPPPAVKETPVTATGESANVGDTSQLAAMDLARFQVQALSPAHRPLLVFVNGRSGGHQGADLCKRLRRMLNPLQVVELPLAQPQPALRMFLSVMRLRILVAGGDGTVAWVLSALDEVRQEMPNMPAPPVAVLPLGTGNDLARVLGWAAKAGWGLEPASVDLIRVLRDVERSAVALLDRWQVTFSPHDQQPNASGQRILNNYYGIGVDAKVAFMMHSLRETYPTAFKSQMGNKLWYTGMGASESLVHSCSSLFKHLQIECDGEVLELPEYVEGILVLNITSFMGGVTLWQGEDLPRASMQDGQLEVVGVAGSFHLGKLQVGLSSALCLRQCRRIKITTRETLPMQVDGEPWCQPPSTVEFAAYNQAWMLQRQTEESAGDISAVLDEVLHDCEADKKISSSLRLHIVSELARRLHT